MPPYHQRCTTLPKRYWFYITGVHIRVTKHFASKFLAFIIFTGIAVNSALAQTEVVQDNGKLLRILNIQIVSDQQGTDTDDIEFVNATGYDVYGQSLNFSFTSEEDAVVVMNQVMDAINAANPTPSSASSAGTDIFYIGNTEDRNSGFIGATGGVYFSGIWDNCAPPNCVVGVAALNPSSKFTYAVFRPAGSLPPEPAPEPEGPALVDGQWVTSLVSKQGFVYFSTDGFYRDQNYISMIVMWPNNSK